MSEKILPIVVACIISDEHILLLRRFKEPFKDQWSLPGGKIEFGEFIDRAALREITEETGLFPERVNYLGMVCELVLPALDEPPLYQHLVFVFKAESTCMPEQPSSEGELRWFRLDKLQALSSSLVATDDMIITKMLLAGQKGPFNSTVVYDRQTYRCLEFANLE
ncbi:MAG: NUDIX domain-containing protein [Syntrophomonadaceae bacterium]